MIALGMMEKPSILLQSLDNLPTGHVCIIHMMGISVKLGNVWLVLMWGLTIHYPEFIQ